MPKPQPNFTPFHDAAGKHQCIYRRMPVVIPGPALLDKSSWRQKIRLLITRLAQSFRLMVGVHDYQAYLQHMQLQHPHLQPMTEKQFYRHCIEARYPGKTGKIGKCPC